MDIIGQKRVHTQNAADVAGRGFVHEKKKGRFIRTLSGAGLSMKEKNV